ncbi:MAG: hypothetical protein J5I90_06105 [Caldilineales bacterium]|nr:hypothetical protein [Caldilineales bacterium]
MRATNVFLIITLILAAVLAMPGMTSPDSQAQSGIPDDEIAYIDISSFIQVRDPSPPAGQQPFTWTSSVGGWTSMIVTDVNADGIDEIVSIGGNTARLWNPTAPGGATAPSFLQTIPSGFVYTLATAGDIIPGDGGRDEIVLQRTDNRSNSAYSVQIYDGNDAGTVWTLVYDELYGVPWLRLGTGPYNDLAGDELVMVRNGTPPSQLDYRIKIISRTPDNLNWGTVADKSYTFPWIDLAVGNVNPNNGGDMAELVTTRDDVLGTFPSILVFWYAPPNPIADAPNGQRTAFPPFFDIALGDVNASGDEEAFFIRDPEGTPSGISMIGMNWGSDAIPSIWDNPGLALGRDLKAVATGDIDGDGKAEVIIANSNSYAIFMTPDVNATLGPSIPAAFRAPVVLVTGNFDGSGLQPAQLAVSTTSLNFSMLRGEANPPNQTFEVLNTGGGGGIQYTVTELEGWMSVTPNEGSTPQTHTVSIQGQGLAPGTYQADITVAAVSGGIAGSPKKVRVTLTVVPTGPILEVTPSSMAFEYNFGGVLPTAQDLNIRNIGDGGARSFTLDITTNNNVPWLKTDKTSGQTNSVVKVSIAPQGLAPGEYTGNIRVNAGSIEGSPVDVPVTLNIEATGMIVTPTEMVLLANKVGPSPIGIVNVDQAVTGENAIHFYAYAVLSGDWWNTQQKLADKDYAAARTADGFTFNSADGDVFSLNTLEWVKLTPQNGFTPNEVQVSLDMAKAPIGETRITIIIDGGPGTPSRWQGVDTRVEINNGGPWLPLLRR